MPAFTVRVRRDRDSGIPTLRLATTDGASVGSSGDGTVTVAVLGRTDAADLASSIATQARATGGHSALAEALEAGAVILDHAQRRASVVTPKIALRLVYWIADSDELVIASHPRGMLGAPARSAAPTPGALFHYVYFHMIPGPATAFQGVAKLDGGHRLSWNDGVPSVTRYWHPEFAESSPLSEPAAAEELHRVLGESVAAALAGAGSAGAFLSGGLDSSTVAGLAARVRPGIASVTMGFDAAGYDEIEFARIASKHFGTRPLEYYVTPDDVLRTLPDIAAAFPEPFGNSSAAAVFHCARIAREHGIELLLAGDGGDELFGGNDRYARQLVFEHYARIPAPIRRGLLEPLVGLAGRALPITPVRKAGSYIEQANVPLPDRLQRYNFLHQLDPADVFAPDLLAEVDRRVPLALLREEFAVPQTTSMVNRMLFLDWKFTLLDNDLVKVNVMADLAGVRVAYPMLAEEVVEFSLRVPGDWKVRNGQLRWFYKRAMRNFLPDAIIDKTKHGFGLPFGVWTRTHAGLRSLSEDALHSLARRRYFRPEFIAEALRLHREGHASYYGELVWILLVLELWLQRHAPEAGL